MSGNRSNSGIDSARAALCYRCCRGLDSGDLMPNLLTQADFARHAGYSRSRVTQLKQSGRLVMEGKRVLLEESLKRIAETKDPNRDDVSERHAEARQQEPPEQPAEKLIGGDYQSARAQKEKYLALQAKADYEKAIGKLVEGADVRRAGAEIGILIRTALENMPDQLAAELAPIDDPARIHALMIEHVERILHDLSDKVFALDTEQAA